MFRPRLITLVVLAVWAGPAQAQTPEVLEPVGAQTVVSAHGGHVVWNELDPASGRWYLRHRFGGTSARLPIPSRSVQFDVDVGPLGHSQTVAVYSRCTREPGPAGGLALSPDWTTASGCDVYETDLATGKERRLRSVSSRRGSETTPSIWKGSIAFARRRAPRLTPRLYVRPRGRSHLRRVPGGTIPPCAGPCSPRPYGGPDAMDLRGRSLAYLWRLLNGKVIGTAGWEVRLVRPGARHARLAASGFIGGACGFSLPIAPQADTGGVTFVERVGECLTTRTSFVAFDRAPRRWRTADPPGGGFAYALSRDAATYYWVRGVVPEAESPPAFDPCRVPGACALVRSPAPAYGPPQRRKVAPPTF